MLKKRLTERKKIVSHFDPSLADKSVDILKKYTQSLNVEDLGDLSDLSVFTVEPLKTRYEYLAFGGDNNYWDIFSTHVKSVTNTDFELKFSDGILTDEMREYFSPKVVQNISSIIIALANDGNSDVFFSQPQGFLDFIYRIKSQNAITALKPAFGAGASNSEHKQE